MSPSDYALYTTWGLPSAKSDHHGSLWGFLVKTHMEWFPALQTSTEKTPTRLA